MMNMESFHGTIMMIQDMEMEQNPKEQGCFKFMTVENDTGSVVNFIVAPSTYILDQTPLAIGDRITGYYDRDAPAVLIFPPQYQAVVIVKDDAYQQIKTAHFNAGLISSDGMLQINLSPATKMELTNGQPFFGNPADRNLIVIYGPATKSIPAQTTPFKIIILCL